VVGGLCQHSAAAVATGVADNGLPTEFPDPAAAEDVLHTDRVDLKPSRSAIRISILDRRNQRRNARQCSAEIIVASTEL